MFCKNELNERHLPEIWPDKSIPWERRRAEISDILQRELFGYRPAEPEEISFTELPGESFYGEFCAGKAPLKKIGINVKINGRDFSFPVYSVIPKGKKNLPFFIHINFRPDVPDRYMPSEEIADNGFAVFSFGYEDVTSDNEDFTNGLAGILYNGRDRVGGECGKIPMWSWAASRVMDYCRTLDCLDFSASAVVGHSRLGKTALYTGMMDDRFNFVISNNSGFAGAALNRNRKYREAGEPFCSVDFCVKHHMQWFCENYRKYADNEETMPYDQHFLVAASAPRHVYVASAEQDLWSDPRTEYLSCCAADEVYKELGSTGFVHPDRYPEIGERFHDGDVGYHIRAGAHYLGREDWQQYMDYIRKHI
ncbi:MAG: hypothetical protein IJF23_06515 [Clostridia bacterium]|nr:hypothetical protein [Clostridia bacterium]